MNQERFKAYSNPDILVSTEWVFEHLQDPDVRLVESNEDPLLYRSGHIPGAIEVDWVRDLNNPLTRDYLGRDEFSELASRMGVTPETTIVFYGDRNNWWACYAFWVFSLFGVRNLKVMDGGSLKWKNEGRSLTKEVVGYPVSNYSTESRDDASNRIFRDVVLTHMQDGKPLIDVRSPEEYRGELLHMPDYPNEGALRGGHIPGAKNLPWALSVNSDDGTFKPVAELEEIYCKDAELARDQEVVVYCRIGERSSHTWFVLKYLLGFSNVKNYDGSWTEWGNLVGAPISR